MGDDRSFQRLFISFHLWVQRQFSAAEGSEGCIDV